MITEQDLQEAIAECQGVQHPNANTCIMLAAFLTIKQHMFPDEPVRGYSYDPPPQVDYYGDSEFSRAIEGRNIADVWPVIDELMTTLQVLEPRLYAGVMRRLE